jgi:hypothetical protein
MLSTTDSTLRELDHRNNDGIDVQLLWNPRTNEISVAVHDERSGEVFAIDVAAEDALLAFHHPFAYVDRALTARALAA